jgi:hypothetical protein
MNKLKNPIGNIGQILMTLEDNLENGFLRTD